MPRGNVGASPGQRDCEGSTTVEHCRRHSRKGLVRLELGMFAFEGRVLLLALVVLCI